MSTNTTPHYFFHRAFRPFFLGAMLFSVMSMFIWWLSFQGFAFEFSGVPGMYWHAHEMVFGYALATVAGFLLTAVMNWTKLNSASGRALAVVVVVWLLARLGFVLNWPIFWVAVFDMLFVVGLFLHFALPIIKTKQWQQTGLAIKFLLLVLANGLFYFGALGYVDNGVHFGTVLGLFLVLAINLTMMRRLIPFFTEKTLALNEQHQPKWLDIFAIVGFLALMLSAAFAPVSIWTTLIAAPLFIVHLIRFIRWFNPKIFKFAVLWPLHVSYLFMLTGMGLYVFVGLGLLHESIAIHALAAGGIGLLCSAILARIALGHSNRNIYEPPKWINVVFYLLLLTAVVRVFFPVVLPEYNAFWMLLSQWGWIIAFALLSLQYWKILVYPSPKPETGILL